MRKKIISVFNKVFKDQCPGKKIPKVTDSLVLLETGLDSFGFAILIVDSVWAFGISAIAHMLFVAGVVITVATFKVVENNPNAFNFVKGYHSYGRGRGHVIMRDKNGLPYKVDLPKGDPGGEHE